MTLLSSNIVDVLKNIWYASNSDDEFIDSKISGNDELSGLDSLKAVPLQNPKTIIFTYIDINSICNYVW